MNTIRNSPWQQNPIPAPPLDIPYLGKKGNTPERAGRSRRSAVRKNRSKNEGRRQAEARQHGRISVEQLPAAALLVHLLKQLCFSDRPGHLNGDQPAA